MASEFKNLPYFDPRHIDYADRHNATSEAVMQLQLMVHQLQEQVANCKNCTCKDGAKTSGRSTSRKTTDS